MRFRALGKSQNSRARSGTIQLGQRQLPTPAFFLGHPLGLKPEPWREFKVDSLMVNAFNVAQNGNLDEIWAAGGVHKFLHFSGPLLMDSGGFQFRELRTVDWDPGFVLEVFHLTRPDIGVVLDHPLDQMVSKAGYERRWEKTLKNTRYMMRENGRVPLMPAVHGYDLRGLARACSDLTQLCRPQCVAIGSLVPLLRCVKRGEHLANLRSAEFIGEAIRIVRDAFPRAWLHALGVGGTTTMHTFFSLGVDSVDSISWRLKAAFGAIQLPGTGDRFVSPRGRRVGLSREDLRKLEVCECPVCDGRALRQRLRSLDNSRRDTFGRRAIHNAFVFTQEASRFRQVLRRGNELDLVRPNYKLSSMALSGQRMARGETT